MYRISSNNRRDFYFFEGGNGATTIQGRLVIKGDFYYLIWFYFMSIKMWFLVIFTILCAKQQFSHSESSQFLQKCVAGLVNSQAVHIIAHANNVKNMIIIYCATTNWGRLLLNIIHKMVRLLIEVRLQIKGDYYWRKYGIRVGLNF